MVESVVVRLSPRQHVPWGPTLFYPSSWPSCLKVGNSRQFMWQTEINTNLCQYWKPWTALPIKNLGKHPVIEIYGAEETFKERKNLAVFYFIFTHFYLSIFRSKRPSSGHWKLNKDWRLWHKVLKISLIELPRCCLWVGRQENGVKSGKKVGLSGDLVPNWSGYGVNWWGKKI